MMTARSKRTTVYLDPDLHKALRLKAIESEISVSDIINEAVRVALSGDKDPMNYEKMLKKLKKDGKI